MKGVTEILNLVYFWKGTDEDWWTFSGKAFSKPPRRRAVMQPTGALPSLGRLRQRLWHMAPVDAWELALFNLLL